MITPPPKAEPPQPGPLAAPSEDELVAEQINPYALAYLNRLGDLLFILARAADAQQGCPPRLWRPGASTEARAAERILPEPSTA